MYTLKEIEYQKYPTDYVLDFNEGVVESLKRTNRFVKDGVYDISSLEFLVVDSGLTNGGRVMCNNEDKRAKLIAFITKHPDFYIGHAYDTNATIFLSALPEKITTWQGQGFNYGSTNVITDCPSTIMILAEND